MSVKDTLKNITVSVLRFALNIAGSLVPVRKNRMMFYSYSGEQYSCSPRYLAEYINENCPGKFEIIWAFRDMSKAGELPANFKAVQYNSLKFMYYYTSSNIIVNNIYPHIFLKTKKNQIMIDTWHGGGAYKCAVTDQNLKKNQKYRNELNYNKNNISLFLSSSEAFTKYFIKKDMQYDGKILNSGLIRNDLFFCDDNTRRKITEKVKKVLGMEENEKIFLYAPTWRAAGSDNRGFMFDIEKLRNTLSERFGGKWRVVFRMHRLTSTELVSGVADACDYPDMQELLLAADFMITDYSSCIWDYILMKKPIILYTYDLEEYCRKQGLYEDIHLWKIPVCETFDEVLKTIRETSDEQFIKNAQAHYNKLGGCDCGKASRRVLDYILQNLE